MTTDTEPHGAENATPIAKARGHTSDHARQTPEGSVDLARRVTDRLEMVDIEAERLQGEPDAWELA